MKNLLILCFGLITTTVFGQFENHSFSISYDQGPGIGFVRDYSTTFQKQFGIVNKKNIGATVGYAYFHNFAKH